jgi:nitroreductase
MTGCLTRNTIIPATFCMLACKAKGTGTCPVRGFEQRKIKKKVGFKG